MDQFSGQSGYQNGCVTSYVHLQGTFLFAGLQLTKEHGIGVRPGSLIVFNGVNQSHFFLPVPSYSLVRFPVLFQLRNKVPVSRMISSVSS